LGNADGGQPSGGNDGQRPTSPVRHFDEALRQL
jgi:hypothetical protein